MEELSRQEATKKEIWVWLDWHFEDGGGVSPPASFEDSFACFILCKFSLENLGEQILAWKGQYI